MKIKRVVLSLGVAVALASSLVNAQEIDKLGWMTGNWVQKSATEDVHENWLGPKGNVMVATNLTARPGKGASFEFLRIGVKDGKLVYFASPGGRPPVEFAVAQIGDGTVTFENPSNPYPTRIIYRRDGDALVARIEGRRQGNDASEEWRFQRAP
jgi:hypothetical protein